MALDIKDAFTQRIGPLPIIAWGGILGGTFVLWRYHKASQANTAALSGLPTSAGDVGTASDFSQGFSNTTPGLGAAGGSTVNGVDNIPVPSDNTTWGKQALNWLISRGVDPADASFALGTYLFGTNDQLNDVQSAALRDVLAHFGAPPEGVVIPPPVTPQPSPNPNPTPVPSPTPTPTPSISSEASAAFAAAAQSFVKAQDLANYTGGPILGPHGISVAPHQLPSSANWAPFDEALTSQARAQQVANFIHAPVWGPSGLVNPQ
jgi:hypothetical protein